MRYAPVDLRVLVDPFDHCVCVPVYDNAREFFASLVAGELDGGVTHAKRVSCHALQMCESLFFLLIVHF